MAFYLEKKENFAPECKIRHVVVVEGTGGCLNVFY